MYIGRNLTKTVNTHVLQLQFDIEYCIDSMKIDTIYNKRHYHLPYVAYWLGQIAITAIGVNMYICPHFLN